MGRKFPFRLFFCYTWEFTDAIFPWSRGHQILNLGMEIFLLKLEIPWEATETVPEGGGIQI